MKLYASRVFRGEQLGRTLDFPTANLDPNVLRNDYKEGIYSCTVVYEGNEYIGALYLGPRLVLGETNNVLEIHILDFDKEIYDKTIQFSLGSFIRIPSNFSSLEEMKIQLQKDIEAVRQKKLV